VELVKQVQERQALREKPASLVLLGRRLTRGPLGKPELEKQEQLEKPEQLEKQEQLEQQEQVLLGRSV